MKTRVEFGNLNRGDNTPILIKEKISADGAPSVRIYQREDVNSIKNLTDRIKKKIKYGVEDFFIEHEKFQPLLKKIGFAKVNQLKTGEIENPSYLLQAIKFGARIGSVEVEDEKKLKEILEKHEFDGDYNYIFYKGGYKIEDFLNDLTKFIGLDHKQSQEDHYLTALIKLGSVGPYILNNDEMKKCTEKINQIQENIKTYFNKKSELLAARPGSKNTETSTNNSPGHISNYFEDLQSEINDKLNEIQIKIIERSTTPKNKDIKNYLLKVLDDRLLMQNQKPSAGDETRAAIDVLFSTSWWISHERRSESLAKVREFCKDSKDKLPEPIRQRIFEGGGVGVEVVGYADLSPGFSTNPRQRVSNPYSGVDYDS